MSLRSACFPFPKAWTLGTGRQGWQGVSPMARGQGRPPPAPLQPSRPPGCLPALLPQFIFVPQMSSQLPRAPLLCPIRPYGVLGSPVHPNAPHVSLELCWVHRSPQTPPKHPPNTTTPLPPAVVPQFPPTSPFAHLGAGASGGRVPAGGVVAFCHGGSCGGSGGPGGPHQCPHCPREDRGPVLPAAGAGAAPGRLGPPGGVGGGFSAPVGPFPLLLLPDSGPPRPPVLVPVSVPVTLNWSHFPSQ